nr:MAG TPA: hypothetical protein [Caudoviricetes sp.]
MCVVFNCLRAILNYTNKIHGMFWEILFQLKFLVTELWLCQK